MLAGISVEYYTRLERGNANGVSEDVLEGVVRALQLDEAERAHLFDLVRTASTSRPPRRRPSQERVRSSVQQILDSMTASPPTSATAASTSSPPTASARRSTPTCSTTRCNHRTRPGSCSSTRARRGVLRRLGHHRPRRRRHPARRSRPRPPRPPPVRPHRRARHPQRRVPRALGRPQRQVPPHRHQALPPPDRRRPHPRLRSARPARRQRPTDARLHRRARLAVTRRDAAPRQLGDHPGRRHPSRPTTTADRRARPAPSLTPLEARHARPTLARPADHR